MTLRQAIIQYLLQVKATRSPATWRALDAAMRSNARAYWSISGLLHRDVRTALRASHIRTLYTRLGELQCGRNGGKTTACNVTHAIRQKRLRAFINWLEGQSILSMQEARKARMVRILDCTQGAPAPPPRRPITLDEYEALVEYCEQFEEDWVPLLHLAWDTGARTRDIFCLTGRALIPEQNIVRFTPAKTRFQKLREVHVPVRPKTMQALVNIAETLDDDEPLFSSIIIYDVHNASCSPTISDYFKRRICKPAGVKGVTMHCFRHAFISRLFKEGVSVPVIASLTGQSPHTVLGYITVDIDDKRKALGLA